MINADLLLLRQICNAYTKLKDSSIISGKIAAGVVATGDIFVSKNDAYYAEFLDKLKSVFGALCVEMEGASIAYVYKLNRVPFVAIRSICDHAEKDVRSEFIENLTLASQRAALVLKSTISGLGDIYNA